MSEKSSFGVGLLVKVVSDNFFAPVTIKDNKGVTIGYLSLDLCVGFKGRVVAALTLNQHVKREVKFEVESELSWLLSERVREALGGANTRGCSVRCKPLVPDRREREKAKKEGISTQRGELVWYVYSTDDTSASVLRTSIKNKPLVYKGENLTLTNPERVCGSQLETTESTL